MPFLCHKLFWWRMRLELKLVVSKQSHFDLSELCQERNLLPCWLIQERSKLLCSDGVKPGVLLKVFPSSHQTHKVILQRSMFPNVGNHLYLLEPTSTGLASSWMTATEDNCLHSSFFSSNTDGASIWF